MAGSQPFSISYAYDDWVNEIGLVQSSGMLRLVEQQGASGLPTVIWELEQVDDGLRPTQWAYGAGESRASVTYLPEHGLPQQIRTTLADGTEIQNVGYTYYPNGTVHTRNGDIYTYDSLNRLTLLQPSQQGPSEEFRYDFRGNLTYTTTHGAHAYDGTTGGGPHAVSSVSNTTYHYDPVGNLQRRTRPLPGGWGDQVFTYNHHGKLTQVSRTDGRVCMNCSPFRAS